MREWNMPLGRGATYSAVRDAEEVITVTAKGQNPTAGWRNALVVSPRRIYPPQLEFRQKAPDGMAAQVITDYSVSLPYPIADGREQSSVTVIDAEGVHRVPVQSGAATQPDR
jgi:hypothetical protein